jgi:DNA mismatch endonuclease (patch repair protein)
MAREPKGKYWKTKLLSNKERDDRVVRLLQDAGWKSLVIWECELSDAMDTRKKLAHFLA